MPVAFAFSAGTFLYVSITHIVPEIGSNLKAWHLIFMVIGIMLPYFLFIDADHAGQLRNCFVFCLFYRNNSDSMPKVQKCKSQRVSLHPIIEFGSPLIQPVMQYRRQGR